MLTKLKTINKSNFLANIIAIGAGIILVFAFAPLNCYPLAIVSPALLLYLWTRCTPQQAFKRGFFFGMGFFGAGISWVYVSIHTFGNTSAFLAGILTSLLVLLFTCYPAVQGYLLTRFFPNNNNIKFYLAFPCSWVLFEWIRSFFLTGLPWLFLGASQVTTPLRGLIPITGEYGASFAVALSSALLVNLIRMPNKARLKPFLCLLVIWFGAYALTFITWTQIAGPALKVSLVQGNIPQEMKWDPKYIQSTLQHYSDLTQPYWDSKIIVWPEAAIPVLYSQANNFINRITAQAKEHQAALITGIPIQDGFDYYNALIVLGNGHGVYYKRHLVPFGEFLPLESLLRGLINFFNLPMSSFSAGAPHQEQLQAAGINFATFICYEVAFANLVSQDLPQAQFLVNISDDAWFDHSFASAQQLQIAQVRSLEAGRYMLASTNDGLTAIISSQGKIINAAPPYISIVLTGIILPMQGNTPFEFMGTMPLIIVLGLILLVAGWYEHKKQPK